MNLKEAAGNVAAKRARILGRWGLFEKKAGGLSCSPGRPNRGFTLLETLGMLAVIAVLAALLLPKIFAAISNARISQTAFVTPIHIGGQLWGSHPQAALRSPSPASLPGRCLNPQYVEGPGAGGTSDNSPRFSTLVITHIFGSAALAIPFP